MIDYHSLSNALVCHEDLTHSKDSLCGIMNKIPNTGIIDNNQLFGLSTDLARILIPVLVTIIIFILGILVNYLLKKIERKSYMKSIKSVLIIWSRLLKNSIMQQSNNCREFNNRLQKSSEMQPERFQFNVILTNKILALELRDQIDTVILNQRGDQDEKAKCLFNMTAQLEFLNLYQPELRSKYDIYHRDALKYMDDWNDAYHRLNTIYTALRIKLETNPSAPGFPFYQELAAIFNGFVHKNSTGGDINTFKNELFNPIVDLCQKYAISNPSQQEPYTVSLVIQELLIIIKKWDVNREGTGQLFNDFASKIDAAYKVLSHSIDKLEKMKFKWLIKIN
jgi:hypothetical protein